jgi:hypothetical protein
LHELGIVVGVVVIAKVGAFMVLILHLCAGVVHWPGGVAIGVGMRMVSDCMIMISLWFLFATGVLGNID